MDTLNLTTYIEKKKIEFEGICHPEPCLTTVTASDMYAIISTASTKIGYATSTHAITYGKNIESVMLTVPLCQDDTDCAKYNIVTYMLPEGREAKDCLDCTPPCAEIQTKDSAVDITALPKSYKDKGCVSDCAKKITWAQDHEVHSSQSLNAQTGLYETKYTDVPTETLTTTVTIPPLCGIAGLSITFEISNCFAEWDFSKIGTAAIPAGGGLERIHGGKWVHTWDFTDQDSGWFPGEYYVCYAHFDKTFCDCNPIPIAGVITRQSV
ncbi:MAG: hypothetical protein HQK96_20350 [Nitrospirae bacterium]|nr:hypothetical protein [Nitrospirota bacterium]